MGSKGTKDIRFDGRFTFPDGTASRYSVACSFNEHDFSRISFEVFWHGERDERNRGVCTFLANARNHIWIPNDDPLGQHVELLGLHGYDCKSMDAQPVSTVPAFSTLHYGIHRTPEKNDREMQLSVRLTPTGILDRCIHELHYTGEIRLSKEAGLAPIIARTRYGELTLEETFSYVDSVEQGDLVTKRVPLTSLHGKIVIPAGANLCDSHSAILEDLEFIRLALSFAYRQPIRIVQLTYQDVVHRGRKSAFCRRKSAANRGKIDVDKLLNPRHLADGGLDRLVCTLRSSKAQSDLCRGIEFLTTSYESNLETAFFMAFSSMETVINSALLDSGLQTYTADDLEAFCQAAKISIHRVAKERGLDPGEILAKVPELRRSSLRRRLAAVCEQLRPETVDLWPGQDFMDGMMDAAGIRNGLFHAAEYSNGNALYSSLIRIRTFTERLLAKLLKVPDEHLWAWRDDQLGFLNRDHLAKQSQLNVGGAKG